MIAQLRQIRYFNSPILLGYSVRVHFKHPMFEKEVGGGTSYAVKRSGQTSLSVNVYLFIAEVLPMARLTFNSRVFSKPCKNIHKHV